MRVAWFAGRNGCAGEGVADGEPGQERANFHRVDSRKAMVEKD